MPNGGVVHSRCEQGGLPQNGAEMKCGVCGRGWPVARVDAYWGPSESRTYLCDGCLEAEYSGPPEPAVYPSGAIGPEAAYVTTYRPY